MEKEISGFNFNFVCEWKRSLWCDEGDGMERFGGWVEVNQVSCSISGDLSKRGRGGSECNNVNDGCC